MYYKKPNNGKQILLTACINGDRIQTLGAGFLDCAWGGGGGVIVLYPGGRQNDIRTPAVVIKTMAKKTILFVSGTRGGVKVGPYKIH